MTDMWEHVDFLTVGYDAPNLNTLLNIDMHAYVRQIGVAHHVLSVGFMQLSKRIHSII